MCSFSVQKGLEKVQSIKSVEPNLEETTFEITFKDKSLISKFRNFHEKYLNHYSGLLHSKINRGKKSICKYTKIGKSAIASIAPAVNKNSPKQLDLFKWGLLDETGF